MLKTGSVQFANVQTTTVFFSIYNRELDYLYYMTTKFSVFAVYVYNIYNRNIQTTYTHRYFLCDLPKGFVDGPEPTDIGAGSKHEQPDDGQSKVGYSASTEHPCETANEIDSKCSAIYCKDKHL